MKESDLLRAFTLIQAVPSSAIRMTALVLCSQSQAMRVNQAQVKRVIMLLGSFWFPF